MAGKRDTPRFIADANTRWTFSLRSKLKSSSRIIWWKPPSTRFSRAPRQGRSATEKFLFPKWIRRFAYATRSAEFPRCRTGRVHRREMPTASRNYFYFAQMLGRGDQVL